MAISRDLEVLGDFCTPRGLHICAGKKYAKGLTAFTYLYGISKIPGFLNININIEVPL